MAPLKVPAAPLALRATLSSFSQILFSRSGWVGALVLAAVALEPRSLALSLLGAVVATAVAWALGLERARIEDGTYGYSAVLVGLGIAATFDGWDAAPRVVVFASLAAVVVTAAAESSLGALARLPALTVPFVAVHYLVLSAAPLARLPFAPPAATAGWETGLPELLVELLRSFGALFFLPRVEVGAIVLVALVVHSRIAALFAALAFGLVTGLDVYVLSLPELSSMHVLGYNAMLTSVALGATWFVPSRSSLLFAGFAVLVCALVTVGSMPVLARVGVPALALPFNATVLLLLYAMRQRRREALPRAVDFPLGTPEENLAYDRSRRARFGAELVVPMRLPVLGAWRCTQGVDGPSTHRGPWRHGFDFEVTDAEGRSHKGDGSRLEHYFGYRLPVVAAAAGTVVRVVDGVKDNRPGDTNVERNWGNVVVIAHDLGLYSVTAHLAPGSLKVKEGQIVQAGDVLGACGSSGRSPVPHVHFQLQATPQLGAPTLPCAFDDVIVTSAAGAEVRTGCVPEKDQVLRSVETNDEVVAFLPWRAEEDLLVEVGGRRERLHAEIDLLGRSVLRTTDGRSSLVGGRRLSSFAFYDLLGSSASLRVLFAALPRLPLELEGDLRFSDRLPLHRIQPAWSHVWLDVVAPFTDGGQVLVHYHARREGPLLVVEGKSDGSGARELATRIELDRRRGLVRASLSVGGKTTAIERVEERAGEPATNQGA